jgi:uncharacterized protein (DUF3084 family)
VGDLRTEVGGLRIEVGDLRTEVGVLRTDVGVLRTEVGDLRTEVGGLRTEVGGQRVELGGLRTQMEQFNRDTRRHFEVIAESLRDDIKLLAEGQAAIIARLDASLADRDADRSTLEFHDLRLTRLETHQGLEPPSRPVRRP